MEPSLRSDLGVGMRHERTVWRLSMPANKPCSLLWAAHDCSRDKISLFSIDFRTQLNSHFTTVPMAIPLTGQQRNGVFIAQLQLIFVRRRGAAVGAIICAVIDITTFDKVGGRRRTKIIGNFSPRFFFACCAAFLAPYYTTNATLDNRKVGTGNARPKPAKVLDVVKHVGGLVPVAHPSTGIGTTTTITTIIDGIIIPPDVDGITPEHHLGAVLDDRSALDPNPEGNGGAVMDAKLAAGGGYGRAVAVGDVDRAGHGPVRRDGAVGGIDDVDGLALPSAVGRGKKIREGKQG